MPVILLGYRNPSVYNWLCFYFYLRNEKVFTSSGLSLIQPGYLPYNCLIEVKDPSNMSSPSLSGSLSRYRKSFLNPDQTWFKNNPVFSSYNWFRNYNLSDRKFGWAVKYSNTVVKSLIRSLDHLIYWSKYSGKGSTIRAYRMIPSTL